QILMEAGNLDIAEACSTFNMGTGFVLIVNDRDAEDVILSLTSAGESAARIGTIEKAAGDVKVTVVSD
nr:hypothetical protein [Syntrophorhabdaceae bacterium]